MWILEAQSLGSNDERSVRVQTTRHYLTAGSHVVGRNVTPGQSNIIVAEDKSISRGHAVINVKYAEQASFQVRDTSRYGTLVNKVELKGAETHVKEGDLLQFGHKSSFRVKRWHCSIALLQEAAMLLQQMTQLGFVQQPAESASCIMLPDRAPITPDLACTLHHQKPYVSCKWLQAILERTSLSDPPAQMTDFKPLVYTDLNPQGLHLQPVYNQHLLSGTAFIVPSIVSVERPRLEAAVQLHGGTISPSSQQESGDKSRVLIVTDMQKADLASAPPNATNLHITTVDHVLEAILRSDTSGMTMPLPEEELPTAQGLPVSNKRKTPSGLTAPAPKRQHTQHVQAAGTSAPVLSGQDNESEASARVTDVVARRPPSLHSSQQAGLQAAQVTEASSRDSAAGSGRPNDRPQAAQQELDPRPAPSNAAPQQPTPSLGAMPDNNTVLWEPLVVRVQRSMPPHVDDQTGMTTTPNFKRFRKLQPRLAAHCIVPFSTKGYVENNIDSEAFLKQQKSKQQQQRVAEELFNANVRVQKQAAVAKAARGRGRGRGRAI